VVLCAVSGGADSIYLLHRLCHLRGPLGFTLIAAHYNHHLRGAESDRDEAFVRSFVSQYCPAQPLYSLPPVELIVGHGDVAAEAKRRRQGIEETARQMRYDFLHKTARNTGASRIAVAHNADDNVETLLLHLIRGTGLQGLTGIPPRRGMVVRPLLNTSRQEIEASLARDRLPHVEDSSNADRRYARNLLRAQVLPVLRELDSDLAVHCADTFRYLRADNDYLNALAADLSKKAVIEDGAVSLPVLFLSGAPGPVAVRVARQLLALTPGGSTDCTGAHLEAILELCRSDRPSGEVCLPHGLTARRAYGKLILTHAPPPGPLAPLSPVRGENPVPGTGWTLVLDGEPWPGLVVRSRRQGDEIALPGRPRRSLKKLFIDRKVPRWDRENIPVAADGGGVIAVAGFGPNRTHPRGDRVRFIQQEKKERET